MTTKETEKDIIAIMGGKVFEGTRAEFQMKFFKDKAVTNLDVIIWCEKKRYNHLEINGICYTNP